MLKRRFDAKTLGALCMLLMSVCLSAFAGLRTDEAWSVNPSDFRYDMSLYFKLAVPEYEDLSKYEIGAFIGDECVGVAERIEGSNGVSVLSMRIRSNSTTADIEFLLRDREKGYTVLLQAPDAEKFQFKADSMVGMPSQPYELTLWFNVSVAAGEHGTVEFKNGLYPYGTELKLAAVAEEGYHFESWSDGNTEADRTVKVEGELELSASFAISSYKAVFTVDGEVVSEAEVEYGAPVAVPEVPEKEGYTFAWTVEIPETMPAHDIEIAGKYNVNNYKAVFTVDGEVVETNNVDYGAPVVVPEVPEKEGYTFAWTVEIPETMPAHDIEIAGKYTVNSYKAVFTVDGEVVSEAEVEYGAPVAVPEVEEKEGYTFAWTVEIPETMPAHDIEIAGKYTVNSYKAVFTVDGEVVSEAEVEFGAAVEVPEVEEREGYTFAWTEEIPETMPAHNIDIKGEYTVNKYLLTVYVDNELYMQEEVEYGAELSIPAPEVKEGYLFDGWNMVVPETMPAHDLTIHGTTSKDNQTGVAAIFSGEGNVTVYTASGAVVCKDAPAASIKEQLAPGLYIVNGKKVIIK